MKAYRIDRNGLGCTLLVLSLTCFSGGCGGAGSDSASPNAGLPYVPPPEGVPATPYWYVINDSVFWYETHDSLALAQMRPESPPERKTASLFALRDLGWRMAVDRGPALQRSGDPQGLEQQVFLLERQAEAGALYDNPRLERLYRSDPRSGGPPALAGVLPGMQHYARGPVLYWWPATVAVVWSPLITAIQANSLLDSLGCINLSNSQLTYQYFVQRGWSVALPAGADLFAWLRMFNADPRVVLAHPVSAMRDPPAADYRLIRRIEGKPIDEPDGFHKLSEPLKNAYYIAHFSGSTVYSKGTFGIGVDGNRFKIQITTSRDDPAADSQLVTDVGGSVVQRIKFLVTAWIPYGSIPALAADSTVKKLVDVKSRR